MHHHLIREGMRTQDRSRGRDRRGARSASFLLLAGYGAEAINPYLAFDTLVDMMRARCSPDLTDDEAHKNYIKAIGKGILKVMSKMGISHVPVAIAARRSSKRSA